MTTAEVTALQGNLQFGREYKSLEDLSCIKYPKSFRQLTDFAKRELGYNENCIIIGVKMGVMRYFQQVVDESTFKKFERMEDHVVTFYYCLKEERKNLFVNEIKIK